MTITESLKRPSATVVKLHFGYEVRDAEGRVRYCGLWRRSSAENLARSLSDTQAKEV
jgi:hypothetical protein